MQPLLWDRYPKSARIGLTSILLLTASLVVAVHKPLIVSALLVLGAAIAFHTEYSLVLDPESRTFEKRAFVKPFGNPKRGSFDDIDNIRLHCQSSDEGPNYSATIVFRRQAKYDAQETYRIATGSLKHVLVVVEDLRRRTGIRIAESRAFQEARDGYVAATSLIDQTK